MSPALRVRIPGWKFQPDPSFRFVEEPHEYYLHEARRWSPSSIFVQVRWVDKRFFKESDRYRGSYVHWCSRLDDEGDLDASDVDPKFRGYLDGWREFSLKRKVRHRLIEKPIYHRALLYATTPDRESEIDGGEPACIEIKTGPEDPASATPPYWWTGPQLAAHDMAIGSWEEKPIHRRRVGVKLFGNGKFKAVEYDDPADYLDFQGALRACLRFPGVPPRSIGEELQAYAAAL